MKLDLLYEIQVPKPWPESRTRTASGRPSRRPTTRRSSRSSSPTSSASTRPGSSSTTSATGRSRSPAPEVVLGALVADHRADPPRLRRHADAARVHSTRSRVAEKVATVDILAAGASSGAPAARRRWSRSRSACRPDDQSATQWREAIETVVAHVGAGALRSTTSRVPRASRERMVRRRSRTRTRTRRAGWRRRADGSAERRRPPRARPAVVRRSLQPVDEDGEAHRSIYREASAQCTDADHARDERTGRRVHARALRRDAWTRREAYGLWDSVGWWYRHLAEFTLEWELPRTCTQEEQNEIFPLLKLRDRRRGRPEDYKDAGHDHHRRHPSECLEKMLPLRGDRRRPAALLRAVRPAEAQRDHGVDRDAREARDPDARATGRVDRGRAAGARDRGRQRGTSGAGGRAGTRDPRAAGRPPAGDPRPLRDRADAHHEQGELPRHAHVAGRPRLPHPPRRQDLFARARDPAARQQLPPRSGRASPGAGGDGGGEPRAQPRLHGQLHRRRRDRRARPHALAGLVRHQHARAGARFPLVPPVGTVFLAWANRERVRHWLAGVGSGATAARTRALPRCPRGGTRPRLLGRRRQRRRRRRGTPARHRRLSPLRAARSPAPPRRATSPRRCSTPRGPCGWPSPSSPSTTSSRRRTCRSWRSGW